MPIDPRLHRITAAQPYPLLFATISGAHLYGFPSPDSDVDLRGVHVLPLSKVVGLEVVDETVQDELKAIARGCITKHHSHHYFGFVETQWNLFAKESPRRVKPLLYVYRVLLTGIWLMRTGEIEANLVTLNQTFKLPFIDELVARKLAGPEQGTLDDADMAFHQGEYERLRAELQASHDASSLREMPSEETRAALNDLLVRVRLKGL